MTLAELSTLLLAVFAVTTGVSLLKRGKNDWIRWAALVSGIALGVVCVVILLDIK